MLWIKNRVPLCKLCHCAACLENLEKGQQYNESEMLFRAKPKADQEKERAQVHDARLNVEAGKTYQVGHERVHPLCCA